MDRQNILQILESYDPSFDKTKVDKAIDFAIHYHKGQTRASGEPYYFHPLQVAEIILEMKLDSNSVITALLHDVVEDTELTIDDIRENFGDEVAKLVDGVTKLSKIEFVPDHRRQAENFRKLLLAMSEDIRVLLVKLADRLHNMRTINFIKSEEKRVRIALETMEIYAPLAERIGIQKIKVELQDICFSILNRDIRNSIIEKLNTLAIHRDKFIKKVVDEISSTIKAEGIRGEVYGRHKSPYSIWMKMQQKNLALEQLSDIIAFRVIVDSISECYQVLGAIHMKYQMVPESFQDFISTPKNNSYMSLHTIVIGPMQQKIEIQIRTKDMHEVAELGVAAHWKYKQDYEPLEDGKQYKWIRELLTILEHNNDPEEFLQNTKLAMYYDQVFCFTPGGKLIALPKKASVIDFAYAVHSDIGHHCIGAKINGRFQSLKTVLKNGDQVEVITSKNQKPAAYWEKYVITGKAMSEISRYTKNRKKLKYVRLGKSILEKTIKAAKIPDLAKAINDAWKLFKRPKIEDFYHDIAYGILSKDDIINKLKLRKSTVLSTFSIFPSKKNIKVENNELTGISGLSHDAEVYLGGCCNPLPGDKIFGISKGGNEITVHKQGCNILINSSARTNLINLNWDDVGAYSKQFKYNLIITLVNKIGTLLKLKSYIIKHGINIAQFKLRSKNDIFFEYYAEAKAPTYEQLQENIEQMQGLYFIHSITIINK